MNHRAWVFLYERLIREVRCDEMRDTGEGRMTRQHLAKVGISGKRTKFVDRRGYIMASVG